MASLYKRGDVYWAKWYDPPGVKHDKSLDTKDKKEVGALLKEIEARLVRGLHIVFPGARPLGDVLTDFLEDKKIRREANTLRGYEGHAKHFRRLLPVQRRIGSIEAADVDKYLRARINEGIKPQTANKDRRRRFGSQIQTQEAVSLSMA